MKSPQVFQFRIIGYIPEDGRVVVIVPNDVFPNSKCISRSQYFLKSVIVEMTCNLLPVPVEPVVVPAVPTQTPYRPFRPVLVVIHVEINSLGIRYCSS